MGQVFARLDDRLRAFLAAQPMFFVASAPLAADGIVNVSPKGHGDTLAVLDDDTTVAYLDLTGSGIETIAHVKENARLTLMFCSFDRQPRILRLSGRGEVVEPGDDRWPQLRGCFPAYQNGRAVVVLHVDRIADSCGYAVPLMSYAGERDLLERSAERRGPAGLAAYRTERNATSLDGLAGLAPADPVALWVQARRAGGPTVGLLALYEIAAAARGVRPHELPRAERQELGRRALPELYPGS